MAAWDASDAGRLGEALLHGSAEMSPQHAATHRLGIAIARRDMAAVAALADRDAGAFSSPLARLRLARACAAMGIPPTYDERWAAVDRRRVDAAVVLGQAGHGVRPGSAPFLFDQPIPIVEAEVDGKRGYFIVDTGAPHSALSRGWCERSGIRFAPGVAHSVEDGSGREIAATTVRIGSLQAGAAARDVPAILFDFPPGLDVAGILSPLDAFPGAVVTLDYAARRLMIGEDAPAQPGVALYWEGEVPLVHARIAGDDAFLLLDSGAGGELLCEHYAQRFASGPLRDATTANAAGVIAIRTGLALPLAIGGEAARACSFAIKPCATTGSDTSLIGRDGFVGGGWMAGRRITIAADRLSFWFTPQEAP
ncbi:retropepsin-like aspartic protease [Sphingomonas sp. S2-65]|uniref:retropepsin-like aspartic protease n=1 Tax=Sphingomonas sp. S2-65 TaxID=2903960 RepID=UPI001F21CF8F|nr:retropepsin-like aspartic protease [Sphingomonas sp. S2-65]UYY56989.1 retroviral-like aspartic protease family protein [Sphingomonas sp. S2-65]